MQGERLGAGRSRGALRDLRHRKEVEKLALSARLPGSCTPFTTVPSRATRKAGAIVGSKTFPDIPRRPPSLGGRKEETNPTIRTPPPLSSNPCFPPTTMN